MQDEWLLGGTDQDCNSLLVIVSRTKMVSELFNTFRAGQTYLDGFLPNLETTLTVGPPVCAGVDVVDMAMNGRRCSAGGRIIQDSSTLDCLARGKLTGWKKEKIV